MQRDGRRSDETSRDRSDAPDAVERVDDGPSVHALHTQAVSVLRDIGDPVDSARDEEHTGKRPPRRSEAHEGESSRQADDPRGGNHRRAEPLDERRREQSREQRAQRERGQGGTERGVAQAEVRPDLRIARDDVREQRAVRKKTAATARRARWLSRPVIPDQSMVIDPAVKRPGTLPGMSYRFDSVPEVRQGLRDVHYLADDGIAGVVYLGRPAPEARPDRGSCRHRQDPAGEVGRRVHRRSPHPPAVLRGPRREQGALRVELQEAAAPHPGRPAVRRLERDARRHLQRGVPLTRPLLEAIRASEPVVLLVDEVDRVEIGTRSAPARDPVRLPGVHPRAGHGRRAPDPARGPHLEPHS